MNFTSWNVMIDIGFWTRLAKNKVGIYQLDDADQPLAAKFRISNRPEKLSILTVDAFSFEISQEEKSGPVDFRVEGFFGNKNTVEDFKAIDPTAKESTIDITQLSSWRSKGQTSPG